jgi:hypothetical protein
MTKLMTMQAGAGAATPEQTAFQEKIQGLTE